jgi:hypothetical protein
VYLAKSIWRYYALEFITKKSTPVESLGISCLTISPLHSCIEYIHRGSSKAIECKVSLLTLLVIGPR